MAEEETMETASRLRTVTAVTLFAMVGVLALAGCARGLDGGGGGAGSDVSTENLTEMSWEAQALESIGFSAQDIAPLAAPAGSAAEPAPGPTASAKADRRDGHKRFKHLRFAFGKRMLHGEAVVQTEDGTKTVVVQRGTVTAIDATSVTVKSADGFTLKWTFGNPIHVVEHRTRVQPSAIAVGTTVGVAGAREGDTTLARLIVVPGPRK
jgi:hypothetical protein